jgi:hypothetical protein
VCHYGQAKTAAVKISWRYNSATDNSATDIEAQATDIEAQATGNRAQANGKHDRWSKILFQNATGLYLPGSIFFATVELTSNG